MQLILPLNADAATTSPQDEADEKGGRLACFTIHFDAEVKVLRRSYDA